MSRTMKRARQAPPLRAEIMGATTCITALRLPDGRVVLEGADMLPADVRAQARAGLRTGLLTTSTTAGPAADTVPRSTEATMSALHPASAPLHTVTPSYAAFQGAEPGGYAPPMLRTADVTPFSSRPPFTAAASRMGRMEGWPSESDARPSTAQAWAPSFRSSASAPYAMPMTMTRETLVWSILPQQPGASGDDAAAAHAPLVNVSRMPTAQSLGAPDSHTTALTYVPNHPSSLSRMFSRQGARP